jgi:hypothetical protein
MAAESFFSILNLVALLSWLGLVVLPRVRWIATTVAGFVVPLLLALVYSVIVATTWGSAAGGFSTLADVATFFDEPWLLLAGWTHYLAFDLLVGSWEVHDARDRGIPHLLVVPCLLLTFVFGPAGWLLYRGVRAARAAYGRPAGSAHIR